MRSFLRSYSLGSLQIAAIVVLVAAAFVFAQAPSEEEVLADAATISTEMATYVPNVRVVVPQATTVQVRVDTTGTIGYRSLVKLIPQVGGRVEWMSDMLRSGGTFAIDEKLLELESVDYQLGVQQAEADLASAQANLELQQAESQAAIKNWRLMHPDGEVPELVAKTPQIKRTQAAIEVAEVRVARAKLDLSRTQFSMPFAGRIVEVNVSPGQYLAPGQSFGTAYSLDELEARVPVSVDELEALKPAEGRRTVLNVNGSQIVGNVARVSAERDRISRVATLFVVLNADADVVPGSFIEDVQIFGPELSDVLVLPDTAEQEGGSFWVVRSGQLVQHLPNVLDRREGSLVVESFPTGEGVVVGLVPNATEGMVVKANRAQL